ncbi:MAG: response regulator [Chloroflexi bacterium]|nr:response regulator [Chloroflexota bacterium]
MKLIGKILVVDDEPSLVELCRIILEQAGFNVRGAYNGRQALSMVTEDTPDLVLLDVMMPGMDGIEVCRRIRTEHESRRPVLSCIPLMNGTKRGTTASPLGL